MSKLTHVTIIAEAGVNHNGSLERALAMVEAAKEAGADYIKFQTGKAELIISHSAPMARYQVANTGKKESQLDMVRRLMLPFGDFRILSERCKEVGIGFISTPFDLDAIDALQPLGMDFWKIPSGEITNYPYLRKIAGTSMPVVMSTGMSTVADIEAAIKVLTDNGLQREKITLLHCNTEYPTPYSDVNLAAMHTMSEHFKMPVGYSDHTQGIEVPIAAVALGAPIIEKHFTLDRSLPGPDHKASIEPDELKAMVSAIRHISQAIGDGHKRVTASEAANIAVARKSIVAARAIAKGEILTDDNLYAKRPGTGISPMRWLEVTGTRAIRDFKPDEMIEL